jgi:hypothetical protein
MADMRLVRSFQPHRGQGDILEIAENKRNIGIDDY